MGTRIKQIKPEVLVNNYRPGLLVQGKERPRKSNKDHRPRQIIDCQCGENEEEPVSQVIFRAGFDASVSKSFPLPKPSMQP